VLKRGEASPDDEARFFDAHPPPCISLLPLSCGAFGASRKFRGKRCKTQEFVLIYVKKPPHAVCAMRRVHKKKFMETKAIKNKSEIYFYSGFIVCISNWRISRRLKTGCRAAAGWRAPAVERFMQFSSRAAGYSIASCAELA
jgi:hypothetical protein